MQTDASRMSMKTNSKYYYVYSSPKSSMLNQTASKRSQPAPASVPKTSDEQFRCKSAFGFHREKGTKISKAPNSKPKIKLKESTSQIYVDQKSSTDYPRETISQTYNPQDAYSPTSPGRPKSARPSTRRGFRENNMATSFETTKTDTSRSPKKDIKSKSIDQRPKSARPESRRSSYHRATNDIQLDFDDLNVDPVEYFLDEGVDTFFVNKCVSAYNASTSSPYSSDRKLDNSKQVTKAAVVPDHHGNKESKSKQLSKSEQQIKRTRSSSLKYLTTKCHQDQSKDLLTMDTPSFRTRVRSEADAGSFSNTDNENSKWKKADKPDIKSLQFYEKRCTAATEKVLAKYTKPPAYPNEKTIGLRRSSGPPTSTGSMTLGMPPLPRKLKPIGIQRESSFLEIE